MHFYILKNDLKSNWSGMVGRRRCTSEKGVSYLSKNYAVKISVIWTCCSCSGSGCGFFVFQSLGKSQSLRSAQTFFFTVPIVIGSIRIVYYTIRHTMPRFLVQKIESNRIEFSKKKFVCRFLVCNEDRMRFRFCFSS